MILTTDIYRYEETLHQPWNCQTARFDVVVLPGVQSCCPTQGRWETPDTGVRVWLNGMTPDLQPLGQCGQCGTHIWPHADIVAPGGPVPEWLTDLAARTPCDYCDERVELERHDGDDICQRCYDQNDSVSAPFTRRQWATA